jgi:hypothetical protein
MPPPPAELRDRTATVDAAADGAADQRGDLPVGIRAELAFAAGRHFRLEVLDQFGHGALAPHAVESRSGQRRPVGAAFEPRTVTFRALRLVGGRAGPLLRGLLLRPGMLRQPDSRREGQRGDHPHPRAFNCDLDHCCASSSRAPNRMLVNA